MSKKKKIILLTIILIVIICTAFVLLLPKENYNKYTCTKNEPLVNGNLETVYVIKYENNNIKKVDYTLRYYGKTKDEKENINTLSQIVKEEAKMYLQEPGFSYIIKRQVPTEFKITYYFDLSQAKDEFLTTFNIKDTLEKQKEYFNNNKEYACK